MKYGYLLLVLLVFGCVFFLVDPFKKPLYKMFKISYKEKSYLPPLYIDLNNTFTITKLKRIADTLAWKFFIAINWPVNNNGEPDTTKNIGEPNLAVWEKWKEISELLKRENEIALMLGDKKIYLPDKILKSFQKLDKSLLKEPFSLLLLHENEQQAHKILKESTTNENNEKKPLLIDQNRNPTFYQIYYNKYMVDYIKKVGLYDIDSAVKYKSDWYLAITSPTIRTNGHFLPINKIYFPLFCSQHRGIKYNDTVIWVRESDKGSIMVKVAWKILAGQDDESKFYTRDACILTEDTSYITKVGLVAMHIAIKYAELPQYLWCSFEHVDNVPNKNILYDLVLNKDKNYNYFNWYSSTSVNVQPENPKTPAQICREIPLTEHTKRLNDSIHNELEITGKNNVWKNYMLVGTQWSSRPRLLPSDLYQGMPEPPVLSNTAIESFEQKTSCISCHAPSKIVISGTNYSTDFVRGIERINRKKKKPKTANYTQAAIFKE